MNFQQFKALVSSDLYRITGVLNVKSFLKQLILGESFQYIFWMRTCLFAVHHPVLKFVLYPLARLLLRHYTFKLGISIPFRTKIGSGFYIGHFGGVIVHPSVIIGRDCNLSQGVTLGRTNRGEQQGAPVIGDRVYIGPGVKIIGAISIGNDVAIGANSVITKSIPDNAVVVGVPGKVISMAGSEGYINKTDYPV